MNRNIPFNLNQSYHFKLCDCYCPSIIFETTLFSIKKEWINIFNLNLKFKYKCIEEIIIHTYFILYDCTKNTSILLQMCTSSNSDLCKMCVDNSQTLYDEVSIIGLWTYGM